LRPIKSFCPLAEEEISLLAVFFLFVAENYSSGGLLDETALFNILYMMSVMLLSGIVCKRDDAILEVASFSFIPPASTESRGDSMLRTSF